MLLKSFKWVFAITIIAFMTACSGTAHIEKDKNTDFNKYRTYAWVDKAPAKAAKKGRGTDLTETNIRQAVDEELQKKGWVETRSRPDVLINYELLVERNQRLQQDAVYSPPFTRNYFNRRTGRVHTFYYPSEFMGYDSYSTTVKEGTVTITMIDSKTDKTVWQGWTTSELNRGNITGKEIERSVKTIFKKFDTGK